MGTGQLISSKSNGSSHSINYGNSSMHGAGNISDNSTTEGYRAKYQITRRIVPSNDSTISATSDAMIERPNPNYDDPSRPLLMTTAPEDRYALIQIGFFILGLTTLLPWNFFITATDYWMYKFRDVTDENAGPVSIKRTELQTFFESYLTIASNVPMLLSMTLNSFYGRKIEQKYRMYGSLSVIFTMFFFTTVFVLIDTDQIQVVFFSVTMVMVVITNIFSAIFQAAMFGLVASFPDKCMHTMVTGQACAGLLAVIVQIISMLNNTGPIMSALWYFLSSTLFLAISILCYWLMDNDYTRYYLTKGASDLDYSGSLAISPMEHKSDLKDAFITAWPMALSTMFTFWTSISVFPAVCVLVLPRYPNLSPASGRFFAPLTTFLIYNAGDLAGRASSAFLPFPSHKKKLLLTLGISRIVLPILILFCNVYPRNNLPVLFESDFFFIFLNGIMSLTSGYMFSASMVSASKNSKHEHLEITGFIISTFIGLGLSLGSLSSNILLRII